MSYYWEREEEFRERVRKQQREWRTRAEKDPLMRRLLNLHKRISDVRWRYENHTEKAGEYFKKLQRHIAEREKIQATLAARGHKTGKRWSRAKRNAA